MIYKLQSTKSEHIRVVFELPSCIWADKICLTGDFNEWDRNSLPMHQSRSGVWRIELDLLVGQRYEFRYLIDGHWQTDYHADGFTANRYGSDNSVVFAEPPPTQVARHQSHSLVRELDMEDEGPVDDKAELAGRRLPWLARPKPVHAVESAA